MKDLPRCFSVGTAAPGFSKPGLDDRGLLVSDRRAVTARVV